MSLALFWMFRFFGTGTFLRELFSPRALLGLSALKPASLPCGLFFACFPKSHFCRLRQELPTIPSS